METEFNQIQPTEGTTATTREKIKLVMLNFTQFLLEKNRRYGDSALNPFRIFSKSAAPTQIENRIDDKLSRISACDGALKKNDVCDLVGYLILYMVSQGWLTFDDLLD